MQRAARARGARLHAGGLVGAVRERQGRRHPSRDSTRQGREHSKNLEARLTRSHSAGLLCARSLPDPRPRERVDGLRPLIPRQDVSLRLPTLPPPPKQASFPLRLSGLPSAPALSIPQLAAVRNLIAQSLDVVDASVWTGDARSAPFIAGQLRLLQDLITEARATLKGGEDVVGDWWEAPMDEKV